MVNFPTRIPDCDSTLLDFFLSSDPSICSTVAFPPLGNSGHVIVSSSIDIPSGKKGMSLFMAQIMTIVVLVGSVFMII